MDANPEQRLTEKIKHCQKTARNLKKENKRLRLILQKSTDTTACTTCNSTTDHPVKQTPLVNYVNKQLMDNDFAMESNQQQLKLALKQYLNTQSDLPTSEDSSTIQSDDNHKQIAKVALNQQVKPSDDNNGQNEAKLNPTAPMPQALFNGTLPDDFYLHLISVIGIQECLISNRLVCSFWNDLVLERCRNQRSLKLFESFNNLMHYGELLLDYEKTDDPFLILKSIGDDLLFEGLETNHEKLVNSLNPDVILTREKKLEASKVMTALFPRVEQLVLCTEDKTLINIEHLLQFYAEQLTSLTMTNFGSWNDHPGNKLRAFNFPKLQSLHTFCFSPEDAQLLSLLPQLESLTMSTTEISLETLLRTGTQLQELSMYNLTSVYTAPVDEFSKRPPINSNLRKFSFRLTKNEQQTLEFISQNLTSLVCLKLYFNYNRDSIQHLHSMTSYLAPLQQLNSLTFQAPVSFFLLDDNQLADIQPLPSVRHLKLLFSDVYSLSRDRFSKALFTAFPNVEQVLIAFRGNCGRVNSATFAALETFAGKHTNVVQLFRSHYMSRLTNFPNIVSPLLGNHRQLYEEYIEVEELVGISLCQLAASLVTPQGENGPNLKSALRPADRLTAMSNLLQLLESQAFAFTGEIIYAMIEHMDECALEYGPSQGAMFMVTCKCVLILLDYRVVYTVDSDKETPFLDTEGWELSLFFEMLLKLVEHYMTQQFDDKNFFLQICKRIGEFLPKFDSILYDAEYPLDDYESLKILLKLVDHYKTQKLSVLDNDETVLLQIHNLIDGLLKMFDNPYKFYDKDGLNEVIREFIHSENRVYRVEMTRALLRNCESTDSCFKMFNGEDDSDSSDNYSSDSDGSFSSAESELWL